MYDRHFIMRYLDNPTRIAFWTVDEMAILFLPIAIGCLFGFAFTGLIISAISYAAYRHLKNNIGHGLLRHAMYWYLPSLHKGNRFPIASYIREYIG